ncbi:Uncharacterized membrane protein [Marinobacter segnicrescens]|uniref:Uncharacterized membrane protein n=1 Tax=Marinobacter segnicrescens TaxID=430453 RepID=A0A1I0GS47_9GAMM|nr:DUF2306 domain-containing protein [Marinobacter segnicrescens]SET73905.1 Uncharacterized membrane protein [Marinobacter segnicrescens]
MTIEPILAASPAIQIHVWAALGALMLGAAQFTTRRGSTLHRSLGWVWIVLIAAVALSSLFIHQIRMVGLWSPIHLLTVTTTVTLVYAIYAARARNHRGHGIALASIYVTGLIGAGAFTLMPGRIMHQVLFGG